MKVIEVNAEKRYEVVTGIDWRESIAELTKGREYRVIAPSSLRDQLIQVLPESQMFFAPNGEAQKSFEPCPSRPFLGRAPRTLRSAKREGLPFPVPFLSLFPVPCSLPFRG